MTQKDSSPAPLEIFEKIDRILDLARNGIARTVNTTQVLANWLIGREIVEGEQHGRKKATYGSDLIRQLASRLTGNYGGGYSQTNLRLFRQFYRIYPHFLDRPIRHPLCDAFAGRATKTHSEAPLSIHHTPCDESWKPGQFHPDLAWSLYRHLVKVGSPDARGFYEIEAVHNHWSARELERQINSLLYQRLAKSRDKAGLLELARAGQQVANSLDVFKDPVIMEFLGLPESPRLIESQLEEALLSNLQAFLLELGKGFAFVARQRRITLDGDHFYIDLVFYHTLLKCFVLIDLKVGKLTHGDLGQMQLYVNYYDQQELTAGDQPTLGLVLCTDKNDAVVKYLLGPSQSKNIFASRYQLHLPTEAELISEIKREIQQLQ
jgi:predicted nuclease of restriction endonuclease-like (RecB) superfamily